MTRKLNTVTYLKYEIHSTYEVVILEIRGIFTCA